MIRVRLTKALGPYAEGTLHDVSANTARRLIRKGAAEQAEQSDPLEQLTVAELRTVAAKQLVDLNGVTKKADIIAAIKAER